MEDFVKQFKNVVYADHLTGDSTIGRTDEQVIVLESGSFKMEDSPLDWTTVKFEEGVAIEIHMNGSDTVEIPEDHENFAHLWKHSPVLRLVGVTVAGFKDLFTTKLKPYVFRTRGGYEPKHRMISKNTEEN